MKKAIIYLTLIILMVSMLIITTSAMTQQQSGLTTEQYTNLINNPNYQLNAINIVYEKDSEIIRYLSYTPSNTYDGQMLWNNDCDYIIGKAVFMYCFKNQTNWEIAYNNTTDTGSSIDPLKTIALNNKIYYSDADLYSGTTATKSVFFSPPKKPPLNLLLEQNPPNLLQLLNPLKVILPILVGGIVLFLSFRKAWQICRTLGMRA